MVGLWQRGAASLAIVMATSAVAAEPQHRFALRGGTLDAALIAFAERTGEQILYTSELVGTRRVPALQGRYTSDEALTRLLAGTGIVAQRRGDKLVVLLAPPSGERPTPAVDTTPPVPSEPTHEPRAALDDEAIVVTGTNIRGTGIGASPVLRFDRTRLDRSGYATVGEAISSLPQNFSGTANEDTTLAAADRTVPNIGLGSGINLRGLGADATLTLVNGRRTAGSGGKGDFTDLSLIPSAAVERVEVLTDGASALYGSDAVGGVVNFILRRPFDGAETRLRAGSTTSGGAQDYLAGQLLGTTWGGGGLLVAYEYQLKEALPSAARRYARSADLTPLGGTDWRLFAARPATVLGINPVTGALAPAFRVPAGQPGTALRASDFLPGANLENQREGTDLLPRQERHNVYATAEHSFSDTVTLYGEGRFAHRRFAFAGAPSTTLLTVTAANPFFVSPNGATSNFLAYSFGDELGPTRGRGRVEALSGSVGGRVAPGGGWEIDVYATAARERTQNLTDRIVNTTLLGEALGATPDSAATGFSAARDGFFNPYGDLAPNSQALLDFVGSGFNREVTSSRLTAANIKADGPLFEFGGNVVRLAVGGQIRRELFDRTGSSFFTGTSPAPFRPTDADRTIKAVFVEALAPLGGKVDLSLAGRHERYSDFGDTTDPKVGLVWRPAPALTLRGSYGRSFRAPALREVRDALRVSPTQLPNLSGGNTVVLFLTGGNPDLGPEKARSYTLGARLAPPTTGFSAELNYFDTRFSDRIGQPALEAVFTALRDPALSPFVEMVDAANPADLARIQALIADPGSIVPAELPPSIFRAIIDGRFVNTSTLSVRGIDALVDQSFDLGTARVALGFNLSYLLDYAEQLTPASAARDRVGEVGFPADLRLRATASTDWRDVGFTLSALHVAGTTDRSRAPARAVEAWTTLDAQLRYEPPSQGGWASGLRLALNAQNLLGTPPPFVDRSTGIGYDAANGDPQGRTVSLQLTKRW